MTIAVGICTYRRPEGLARLLAALPEGCRGLSPIVLVVDNDGTDPRVREIVGRARGLDLRLVEEPCPGISAARNRVFAEAEAAGATLLAMLDDDEWPAPGWLAALLERRRETGAAVVGGVVQPCFPGGTQVPEPHRRFWSVLPQRRGGRPFVHATSNVLIDLAAVADMPRPLFDDAFGLSGGGDLVFFSRLFDLGIPMAWAERALAFEEVPPARASWAWLHRRRHRVGNHMVMDEELRQGRLRPMLKTAGVIARLPVYPLLGREPGAPWIGWRLEAAKLGGRITAHFGLRAFEYARDGVGLRRATRPAQPEAGRGPVGGPPLRRASASRGVPARLAPPRRRG